MKKRLTLMMLAALVAVASVAQPVKRSPELRLQTAEQVMKALTAKPMHAVKAQAPRKANVTVDGLVGLYTAVAENESPYHFKVELKAGDVEGEVLLSGLYYFDNIKATIDAENSALAIEVGQVVTTLIDPFGDMVLTSIKIDEETGYWEYSTSGTLYAFIDEDGVITFEANSYICMTIAEGDYAGMMYGDYFNPGITLTPGFADFAITPWDDVDLEYLQTDKIFVGNLGSLVTGLAWNSLDEAGITVTTTDLINVADPDDQIRLSVGNNLVTYCPILVGDNEIMFNESLNYGNEPISTLTGEQEYIYIDNYGSEEDFEKVKDVLTGKIAVCNRGSISFYVKANAAAANGAIGLIVVNNQDGTIFMALDGYEYDKPAVSISKADGELLKSNATYVDGDAPYYQGKLTVSDIERYTHNSWSLGYGHYCTSYDEEIYANIPDWSNVTHGATYKATINYEATYWEYNEGMETIELTPTTLTLVVPEKSNVVFTPWNDLELTYGSTEGDIVGNPKTLISGVEARNNDYVYLIMTSGDLVNIADPDDKLLVSVGDNLVYKSPILVGDNEIMFNESLNYGNEPISTLTGEQEYIYIDNYGSEEDFEKVKDVLAGKIAVCNRGSISFYVKANAAAANGAIGLIVVNNQEGIINMILDGYEYDKPAVSISKADGELLKSNATYVDGDAPYYQGKLTVSDLQRPFYNEVTYNYGYNSEPYGDANQVLAVVPDWTNATPGATYKATINYEANFREYYPAYYTWDEASIETTPTTLTVTIPDATSIADVNVKRNADKRIVNLMGIPVGKEYKGIVIQNGKKVLQ